MWKVLEFLMFIFNLKRPGTTSQGPRKKSLQEGPRAVETLPWHCQSTEPNDAPFVDKLTVNGGFVNGDLDYIRLR